MKYKKGIIMVSEPWDFKNQHGQNIIEGKIVKVVNSKCLVFKANYLVNFDETIGDILVLSPRQIGGDFRNLKSEVDINGGLLLRDFDEQLNEEELKNGSKFVIIGDIRCGR